MKDGKTQGAKIDPETKAIGARIRLARKAKKMTIEQLAEAAETSPQFLSKVEKGEQSMTMGKLAALIRALKTSANYILMGYSGLEGEAELAVDFLLQLKPIQREMLAELFCQAGGFIDSLGLEEG